MKLKIVWRLRDKMTEYILDSNVFISPFNDFYRMPLFPSFWAWYKNKITVQPSNIILPRCVFNELKKGNDKLSDWVDKNLKLIVYDETKNSSVWKNYAKVIDYISNSNCYKNPGIDEWKKSGKADPLLIAIAMTLVDAKVVTFEKRTGHLFRNTDGNIVLKNKNNLIGSEPKIPDVADQFNIDCIDLYDLEEELKARI